MELIKNLNREKSARENFILGQTFKEMVSKCRSNHSIIVTATTWVYVFTLNFWKYSKQLERTQWETND